MVTVKASDSGAIIVRLMGDASHYQKMLAQSQAQLRAFGRAMSTYVTAPLAIMGGLGLREFSKFNNAMTESLAIMKTTTEQQEAMRQQALRLAEEGTKAPEEIARSYFYLASAGLSAEQAMKVLPILSKFATAGAFDMARATELVMDAQSALGMKVADASQNMVNATRVMDVLTRANVLANGSVEQFAVALTSKAGSAMKAFGVEMEQGVAMLAAMADQGMKAELAGNSFARIMTMLQKGAIDNAAAFRKYNFALYDTEGRLRPLYDIVGDFERILLPMSAKLRAATLAELGFEARIQGAVLPLLGTSAAIRRYYEELKRASGYTEMVAEKQMLSFSKQMGNLWNRVKVLAISIGEDLAPRVTALADRLKGLIEWWKAVDAETKHTVVTIGLYAAAIGPAALALAVLVKGLGAMATGLSAVIALTPTATVVLAALAAVFLYELVTGIERFNAQTSAFEASLKSMAAYQKGTMKRMRDEHRETMAAITSMPEGPNQGGDIAAALDANRNRRIQLRREMQAASKEVQRTGDMGWWASEAEVNLHNQAVAKFQRLNEQIRELQAEYKELEDIIPGQIRAAEQARVEAENAEVARLNDLQLAADEVIKELDRENDVMNKSAAGIKLYDLYQQGLTGDKLKQVEALVAENERLTEYYDNLERGKKMAEEQRTAQEKYNATLEDLKKLREINAIDEMTYTRAAAAAKKELREQIKEQSRLNSLNLAFANNKAVREGSDEFYQLMQLVPGRSTVTPAGSAKSAGEPMAVAADPVELELQRRQAETLDKLYQLNQHMAAITYVPLGL